MLWIILGTVGVIFPFWLVMRLMGKVHRNDGSKHGGGFQGWLRIRR